MKTILKKFRDLFIVLAVFNFGFYNHIAAQANVEIPCLDKSFDTEDEYRELGIGNDANLSLARTAALMNAKKNIKTKLGGIVKGLVTDYLNLKGAKIGTLTQEKMDEFIKTVLNDAKKICESANIDKKGIYNSYIVLSINKKEVKKGIINNIEVQKSE